MKNKESQKDLTQLRNMEDNSMKISVKTKANMHRGEKCEVITHRDRF